MKRVPRGSGDPDSASFTGSFPFRLDGCPGTSFPVTSGATIFFDLAGPPGRTKPKEVRNALCPQRGRERFTPEGTDGRSGGVGARRRGRGNATRSRRRGAGRRGWPSGTAACGARSRGVPVPPRESIRRAGRGALPGDKRIRRPRGIANGFPRSGRGGTRTCRVPRRCAGPSRRPLGRPGNPHRRPGRPRARSYAHCMPGVMVTYFGTDRSVRGVTSWPRGRNRER